MEQQGILRVGDEENNLSDECLTKDTKSKYMRRPWTIGGTGLAIVFNFIGHQPKDGKQEL